MPMFAMKRVSRSLFVVGLILLVFTPMVVQAASRIPVPAPTLKSRFVASWGLDRRDGDVRWILPGLRALDPTVFGTPAAPLGFEPDVGVPEGARLRTPNEDAYTTTSMPTPFSNNFKNIRGSYELWLADKTLNDDPRSRDREYFKAKFKSPDGKISYEVRVQRILPTGVLHPVFGGVGVNMIHHGITGIGTKLQPTAPTFGAFWGIGTIKVDGWIGDVGANRLIHGMITCNVRNEAYELVFDDKVDCSRIHFHLFLPPFQVKVNGNQFAEVPSPVPTDFDVTMPNGMIVKQPFIHNMFENIRVRGLNY